MHKSLIALAVAASFALPSLANAQSTSPHSLSGNMSLVSDYRFRGLSQTFEEPALQGGFDYSHSSGLYLGNWNSSISDTFFAGAPLEMDFYGGYKFPAGPVGLDVGVLYYYYPGSDLDGTIDNTELYVGASWKWLSAKYSHNVSDFFNAPDTKNSYYLDLAATFDLGNGWGMVGHVGRQKVKNISAADYTDYKIGVTKDLGGWLLGAALVDTNADEAAYTFATATGDAKFIGDSTIVFSVGKSF
jgi:uncharacterized protein (TIGR02001 family)